MEPFAPLIDLLVLLSVLSITAERLTNTFKLRGPACARSPLEGGEAKKSHPFAIVAPADGRAVYTITYVLA